MADGIGQLDGLRIGVVGAGVGGLGAAWLLSQRHHVTLLEQADYLGGHSHTVDVRLDGATVPVDTGFIVYNELNYPNLTQLFAHLGVVSAPSDMSFAVSLHGGALEYAGTNLAGLLAQPANLLRPRFWRMLADLRRFYASAAGYWAEAARDGLTLGELLARHRYSAAFLEDHLLPMAGAIWSANTAQMAAYPAQSFLNFFANHGLVQLTNRPAWRTVLGGSREYVRRLVASISGTVHVRATVVAVVRYPDGVAVQLSDGRTLHFDAVVIGAHADQALAMLDQPSAAERELLGVFRYAHNRAVLHEDASLMPHRRTAWASWNYLGESGAQPAVTYWMNRLQPLATRHELFVTLNPPRPPRVDLTHREFSYAHPLFERDSLAAQGELWRIQGAQRVWFCGSYFGYGFHEDALESGLWVAEALGGMRRPWQVPVGSQRTALGHQTSRAASLLRR